MKRFLFGLVAALLASGTVVSAQARVHNVRAEPSRVSGAVRVVFSTEDVRVLREYYTPRYRRLPPGLQRKYARTGQLPPGWQKKFAAFPFELERRLVALPAGYSRGVVDGHAVIFNDRTNVLIDVAVLF